MKTTISIISLILFLSISVFSQTLREKEVFDIVNQVRMYPDSNIVLDDINKEISTRKRLMKNPNVNVDVNFEDRLVCLEETKQFLLNQSPVDSLVWDSVLYERYVKFDITKTESSGKISHTYMELNYSENIIGFGKTPLESVKEFILDCRVESKGHRKNIFSDNNKMCVFENLDSKKSPVNFIQGFTKN